MALRIVFCGTPAFAVPSLQRLIAQPDIQIEGVVTQPDRPRGRGHEVSFSAVKEASLAAGLSIYQPEKIKSPESLAYFERLAPDCVVIIAYGQIISPALIAIPRMGWINLHASLLPKYRGAAPINWAILNGETRTGVTTMQIDAGLDTGPTLLHAELAIGPDETAPELTVRLAETGAPLVIETLLRLNQGDLRARAQDSSRATSAPPLKKADGRIDWSLPATAIYNRMRALQPWPGTYTTFRGTACRLFGRPAANPTGVDAPVGTISHSVAGIFVNCGAGTALDLESIQLEGRKRVTARDFANGAHLQTGEKLGNELT